MKKKRKIIFIIILLLLLVTLGIFLIYKFDSYILNITTDGNDTELKAKSSNNNYYLIYLSHALIIDMSFNKLNVSDLNEGDTIYVLDEPPPIIDTIAFTDKEGHFLERLEGTKLVILVEKNS